MILTVVVADAGVEVDLSVIPLAFGGLETSLQHMVVLDANVLSSVVESHFGWCLRGSRLDVKSWITGGSAEMCETKREVDKNSTV